MINMDETQAARALIQAQKRAMVKVILEQVLTLDVNDDVDKEVFQFVKVMGIRRPTDFFCARIIKKVQISNGNNGTKPVSARTAMLIANIEAFAIHRRKTGIPFSWSDWANITTQEFDAFIHGTGGQVTPARATISVDSTTTA